MVRVRRAIYANMNEGLAIVRSGMRATGAASDGFASCFAVVLRTAEAVGVAPTSSIPSLAPDLRPLNALTAGTERR